MNAATIVLADVHALFRDGIAAVLAAGDGYDIVGRTGDGAECVRLVLRYRPTLLIFDTFLHGLEGIEVAHRIASRCPETRLLCVTASADPRKRDAVMAAGAQGFVLKSSAAAVLREAARAVLAGRRYVDGASIGVSQGYRHAIPVEPSRALSRREREIAQLLAEGHGTRAIAERLHLSIKTIGTHREHILRKLGIVGIAALTRYALREGLISPDE